MFLGWLPQIISNMNFKQANFLDRLLLRIASTYPRAILYPFQLSYDQYKKDADDQKDRSIVLEILNIIRNRKTELLIRGLLCLCVPEKMLSYHLIELSNEMQLHSTTFTNELLKKRIKHILSTVWPANDIRGQAYQQEDIEKYRNIIKNLQFMDSKF